MEGIVFMKKKYKTAGMSFECFHNRGHPASRKMVFKHGPGEGGSAV